MELDMENKLKVEKEDLVQIMSHLVKDVKDPVDRDINKADLLHGLLNSPWLQSLLKVYVCLQQYLSRPTPPYLSNASGLSLEILSDLRALQHPSHEARQLYHLLMKPHMQALLSAHDIVMLKDYEPVLPPMPEDLAYTEDAMRIISMVKNNHPLGATIRKDKTTGQIYVARVIHGGLADRSDLLHAGDRLVEVNGQPVFGLEPEQIIKILADAHERVMFKVVPGSHTPTNNKITLFVRAMVDYNPHQDPDIPCVEAGMAFKKGNVLEIVDQTDCKWWQVKKLPCSSSCAGLVPSACMLQKNKRISRKLKEYCWSESHSCSKILNTVDDEDIMALDFDTTVETDKDVFESAEFRKILRHSPLCPYEEVVGYQRHPEETPRLIALLGPSRVGVNELCKKLIEINPSIFLGPIPHTTRPKKMLEESEREYHFINKNEFEKMLHKNRFVKYGEFRGHLYGTSVDAVIDVVATGKICVIDIEPNAIASVRTPELKAYIIYIKPPPIKPTRINTQLIDYCTSRPSDGTFYEMEEEDCSMEQLYGQFFDHVIVNDSLQSSCVQLMEAVRRAQEEPQWVPSTWVKPREET